MKLFLFSLSPNDPSCSPELFAQFNQFFTLMESLTKSISRR